MPASIVRAWDRLRSRRLRLAVGLFLDLVSNVALVLSAFGVTQVPEPLFLGIAVLIGTALLLSVIWSYHKDLERRLTPVKVAESVNELRKRLRDLSRDAYAGPQSIPQAVWQGRCVRLVEDCESFVSLQRNKFVIPMEDAITGRRLHGRPRIDKNAQSMMMLGRIDQVLASIHSELRYE